MRFEFNVGLLPFVIFNCVMGISAIINLVFGSIATFYVGPEHYGFLFGIAAFQFLLIYVSFALPAFITILRANDRINLTTKNKIIGVLTYMFFFYEFVLAFFDGAFHPKKRTTWTRIKHTGQITNKDLLKK